MTLLEIPGCTRDRLRSFERHGLIESPTRQLHVRGRPYVYAAGTEELVRALVETGNTGTHLDNLGFAAWWAGYAVPTPTVRRIIKTWLNAAAAELRALRVEHGDALGVGEAMADRAARPQSRDRLARRADIRRLKHNTADPDHFRGRTIPALGSLVYGEEPAWALSDTGALLNERSSEEILQATMGVDRAASQLTPDGRTVLPKLPSLPEVFGAIQQAGVTGEGLTKTLDGLTDDQLVAARDTARAFVDDGGAAVRRIETEHGRGAFGLGLLAALAEDPHNLQIRPQLVVGLAATMERAWTPEQRENLPGMLAAFSEAAE